MGWDGADKKLGGVISIEVYKEKPSCTKGMEHPLCERLAHRKQSIKRGIVKQSIAVCRLQ
jgi:hypothetical protein